VEQLEKRCSGLQKKLNSRPIVFQAQRRDLNAKGTSEPGVPGFPQEPPAWVKLAGKYGGPQAEQIAQKAFDLPTKALRSLTHRLLQKDSWLWLFYAHVLILYVIAASCYAQTTPLTASDVGSPVDAINKRVAQAAKEAAASSGSR